MLNRTLKLLHTTIFPVVAWVTIAGGLSYIHRDIASTAGHVAIWGFLFLYFLSAWLCYLAEFGINGSKKSDDDFL